MGRWSFASAAGAGVDPEPHKPVQEVLLDAAPLVRSRIPFWAWLPVPLFLGLILVFHAWGPQDSYESVGLGLASNILLSAVASLLVVYLVSQGFVRSGSPALLFLSCGVLAWGCAGALALHFGGDDANQKVTIHNLGAALAGACHLAGVLLIGRRQWTIRSAGLVLPLALAGASSAMILMVAITRAQILPVFFVPGQGGTWFRQVVLGSAIMMFTMAAVVLLFRPTPRDTSFDRWYGLSLYLVAVGLFGVMFERHVGDTASWLGRSAHFLSGICMLVAALAGLREANLVTISLQASLHESEQRFRALVMASSDIVFRMTPDWQQMHPLIGRDLPANTESAGRAWLHKYVHPDDHAAVLDTIKQAIVSKSTFECEHRVLRADGSQGWTFSRAIPVKNEAGEIVEWFGMASDISKRKLAEAALRQAQAAAQDRESRLQQTHELLETVTQAEGVIVAVLDRDLRYSYFNRAYAEEMRRVMGLRIEIGASAVDILAGSPEQALLAREWRQVLEGDSLHQTVALGRKGHRRRFYLDHKGPIRDKQGVVVGASEVAIDISERKLAEDERERLLQQLRHTQDQLYAELDAMTRLQRLGSLLPREAGLKTVLSEIVGAAVAISEADFGNIQILDPMTNDLRIVAHRGFEDWWLQYWARVSPGQGTCGSALESGERVVVEDVETSPIFLGTPGLEMQRRAGIRACQSTPLVSRSGKVLGVFSTHYRKPGRPDERALRLLDLLARQASDMIEGIQAEEALRSANAQLLESDRRKNEFLAALSHELRNPLAPISNSLFVLDHAPAGSEQAGRAREIIARQVGQLSALVNDLLDITRITRNKIQLNRERIDLNEAVRLAVEDSRSLFERSRVHLELMPSPVPVFVLADRTRVAQIVGNLLNNSAKFTREGGHTRVWVVREGQEAVLRVADGGIGMDARTLQRLFEPFMQAAQSLDRSQGGLGLGLALVKGLAELHGGRVCAHSDGPGKGAELTVRLPLDIAAESVIVVPDIRKPCPRRRVLIIEDNLDAASSLREALEFSEHQVQVAHTGPDGISKAETYRPEVILCDIGLPQMDGYQVARALRANKDLKDTYLVALSGYALPEDLEHAFQAGFDRHLSKPPSLETLDAILLELGGTRADGSGEPETPALAARR